MNTTGPMKYDTWLPYNAAPLPKDPGHWQSSHNQGHVTTEEGGKLQRRGRSSDRPPAQRVL
jgi:hypothetical protein